MTTTAFESVPESWAAHKKEVKPMAPARVSAPLPLAVFMMIEMTMMDAKTYVITVPITENDKEMHDNIDKAFLEQHSIVVNQNALVTSKIVSYRVNGTTMSMKQFESFKAKWQAQYDAWKAQQNTGGGEIGIIVFLLIVMVVIGYLCTLPK